MRTYYRVGRHHYCVNFCDDKNTAALLPSSEPFRVADAPTEEPLLFELTVDDTWRPVRKGKEIGQFDCGGNNHGVYRLEDGSYQILLSDVNGNHCCLMQASADFSSATVCLNGDDSMRQFGLNNALMMMYAFAGADKMTVLMHASVVRKDGMGYLCLGVSGTGKSTHTHNWLQYVPGTDLMNDDNPVVRVCEDGVARVFGSPWSGKTPCYRDVEAPIGGFLQLKQAPYNKIERMRVVDGYASLLPSCSVMKWDRRDHVGTSDTVAKLLELVPVYFLENLPNEEAVKMSYEAMTGKRYGQIDG
ncbi:MAG: hypothetical protein IKP41_03025 [Bacteroidaceae bacterium]|nr:hypothetical protein [Bacteroidaceae bacterium]